MSPAFAGFPAFAANPQLALWATNMPPAFAGSSTGYVLRSLRRPDRAFILRSGPAFPPEAWETGNKERRHPQTYCIR
jgi:hypothetical protein